MNRFQSRWWLVGLFVVLVGAAFGFRGTWIRLFQNESPSDETAAPTKLPTKVILNERTQKNLGLTSAPAQPTTYWKTIAIPGMVVDRPGFSDRGVATPAAAVVSAIHHVPGDTVRTGEPLFTLKLFSESVQLTQTDLFKSTQELAFAETKLKAIGNLGTESKLNVLEVESLVRRLTAATKASRQELLLRGFTREQVDGVAEGKFVSEIVVSAPPRTTGQKLLGGGSEKGDGSAPAFEVQELKVELGQQVPAGQTLCLLANHRSLAIQGKAFRDETRLLERSVKEGWPVQIDFEEDNAAGWPAIEQTFHIHHIANSIDPATRTFAFLLPLDNQVRSVERDGRSQLLWRFRPGQKVRILVRVEKLDDVFVLPADAVTQDGAEAYVFTQNVNTFERQSVRLLLRDRQNAVLANDKSLTEGIFVVQSAAAQLNRMVKASTTGVPRGFHVHADGSLHKNEDEGK